MTEQGYLGLKGHLRAIWGPVWDQSGRVILRSILSQFWTFLDPISGNLIYPQIYLHLAVGRALALNILNMGPRMVLGLGTGIALPAHPSIPIPRVHPCPTPYSCSCTRTSCTQGKYGRGAHIRRPTHLKALILRL